MPNSIGYQDLASLMARQPDVSQRARAHMLASPFGTIHAATFSFPQPVGTLIPEPPLARVASLAVDPAITASVTVDTGMPMQLYRPRIEFPSVNRALKGDLLISRSHDPSVGRSRDLTPGKVKTVTFTKPSDAPAEVLPVAAQPVAAPSAVSTPPQPKADLSGNPGSLTPADLVLTPDSESTPKSQTNSEALPEATAAPIKLASAPPEAQDFASIVSPFKATLDDNAAQRLGRLYFGNNPVGDSVMPIQPWPMDEEVQIVTPPAHDPDIKASAVTPPAAQPKAVTPAASSAGETVAPKGEVTGAGKRPRTPAERLGLDTKQRAKAEKCLADAVYFESRGEVKRGQIAVAQVVMNRVFSGFYPNNVCGVVYQNAHRKLACQFTFACDGIPDVVKEPDMWAQAKEISHDMLDGKLWLPEVGHSTHYHAYWVHPAWVREMRRMQKIGVHSFYRPRAWGDGSEVPPLNQSMTKPDETVQKAKL